MGLVKRTYTDNVTVITAENLNDIQDEIILQGQKQVEDEAALALKVNAVAGKGLSTNDFTDSLAAKLNGIASGAEVNVQADWNEYDSTLDSFIKNKPSATDAGLALSWTRFANTTYPTGFRVGFYQSASGSYKSDNKWLCSRTYFASDFSDYEFMTIKPPSGYRCWVCEYDASNNFVQTFSNGNDDAYNGKTLFVPITPTYKYSFTFGRFGNSDASDYNNDTFLETFVCTRYRYATSYIRTMEHVGLGSTAQWHFNVTINPTYQKNEWVDAEATASVNAVLVLPSSYRFNGTPTKLIFMHHGQVGTVTDTTWYSEVEHWADMYGAYLNAGFAVFDVNGTGAYSAGDQVYHRDYGAPNALQAAHKAYEYILAHYNIDPMIFVHGSSMGGATAIAFAKTYPDIVRAVALVAPADLRASALNDTYKEYIATNYGYASASAMASDGYEELKSSAITLEHYNSSGERQFHTFDYDWLTDAETHVADFPVPVKIWQGTADETINPAFSEKVVDALRLGGHMAYFRPVTGGTHAIATGGNSTVNAELPMWFKRFA